ncbi:HEAT repeat domain-containing protein [Streptomyces sp. NPDC087226]|uniref:HEAT repeat domain-containing protein n=1 Tax=Streptomyces sp. NPDC087226 TaxID=3365771 RepID=UPI00380DC4B1
MTDWHPLPLGSSLNDAPTAPVPAPVIGKLELLPFNDLSWEDFERIQWRVMRDVEGLRHAQLYGERGQAQYGLDVVALAPDGSGTALQSKKYKQFGPAQIKAAVKKFRTTRRPFSVDRLIIGVARPVRTTKAIEEFAAQRKLLQPIELDLWDSQELSYLLRGRPEIVIEFFGMPTAEAFCLPFKVDVTVVPRAEVVAVREAIARTPEVTTGAQKDFDDAAESSDSARALSLIEAGQAKLRDAGFWPHARQYNKERVRLLAKVGRTNEAARHVLDEFWAALDQGLSGTAQITRSQLDELSRLDKENDHVNLYRRVIDKALDLYNNPTAHVPDIKSILIGDPLDRIRLALLAGETALANDYQDWLTQAAPEFVALSGNDAIDRVFRTRLRLLLADATGVWEELLSDARRLNLGHGLLGLVTARYARHLALQQKFEEADLAWDEASGSASLAQQWSEASTWIFSRRAFRGRWNPFTGGGLLPLQTAIRGMGTSSPLLPVAAGAHEDALAALSEQKLRAGAISAQRALRDAVSISDWVGEERARRVLAAILVKSDEPVLAARHLIRAGAAKAIEELGKSLPRDFIDIIAELGAPNYWSIGTGYRLLATQSDIIPDSLIDVVSQYLVGELVADRKPDLPAFAASRYNNAVKALAGISERLDVSRASAMLSHFEQQSPVEKNHYRYHDEDEAVAVAKVALTHIPLAARAVSHLVALLGRSQAARNSITLGAIDKNQPLAHDALTSLAAAGNQWASEMLSFEGSKYLDADVTQQALTRLTTPLKHATGVYSTGTNAIGDSLLIRHNAPDSINAAVGELLSRADDPHIGSADRGEYLIAASNLVPHLEDFRREEYFEVAVRMATSPKSSDHDKIDDQFRHKLGGFRIDGTPRDSRGQAVVLAAALARDAEQRERVRSLVYSRLGEESDFWPTRALQQLGDTVKGDLAFLASQGWAIRSLVAILWVEHGEPPHLGLRLAADPDVRVRRAFAGALSRKGDSSHAAVFEELAADPAYSVRSALGISFGESRSAEAK